MNTLKKLLDHVIYSFKKEHFHTEPAPKIFQQRPLVWTPHKRR